MRTLSLRNSYSVTLDGNGDGTVQAGPSSPGEQWQLAIASVSVSTNVAEAQCKIYIGADTTQPNYADGTLSGSTGDSTDRVSYPLNTGQSIWAVWSGGDSGSTATLVLQGQRTLP
jgi:hypothetical protein